MPEKRMEIEEINLREKFLFVVSLHSYLIGLKIKIPPETN
jgi:hypothetical protein